VSINSQKFLQYVCLFRKYQLQGLRSRQNRSLLIVNEDFGGERNTANGTLWTDTNWNLPAGMPLKTYGLLLCINPDLVQCSSFRTGANNNCQLKKA
jgi:hypothetical protein